MSLESILVGVLAIGIGLAWAFYGTKVFFILLPIWAFLFGLLTGAQWAEDVFGQGFFSTVLSWGIGIGFGLVLAVICYFWYYAAITIAVGALGYALGVGILDFLNIDASTLGIIVGLIVGAVFAVAAFVLAVPIWLIVIVSAFGGAAAVINGVLIIFGRITLADMASGLFGGLFTDTAIGIIAWIALGAVAFFYQTRDLGQTAVAVERSRYRY